MVKKGQVTVFIIAGILIIVAIALIFVFKDAVISGLSGERDVQSQLNIQMQGITNVVSDCVDEKSVELVERLSLSGAVLNPLQVKHYYSKEISILCKKIGDTCYNVIPSSESIEKDIEGYMVEHLASCIDIFGFESGDLEVNAGEFSLDATINSNSILYEIEYPVTLILGTSERVKETFVKGYKTSFGEILNVVKDVVEGESLGEFDYIEYSVDNPKYWIELRDTADTKVYKVVSGNEEFWFGVEK
jgi:hypothetical protein